MHEIYKGILAAFVGTLVISLLMLIKNLLGILPQFNIIKNLSIFAGTPNLIIVGWLLHFIIGTFFWGVFFAILASVIPGPYWFKGIFFGIFAWLLMMLIFMPSFNEGFFASKGGMGVVLMTCVTHILHGVVMGYFFGLLVNGNSSNKWLRKKSW